MGNNLTVTGNLAIGGASVFTGTVDLAGGALDTDLVTNFNADLLDSAHKSTDGTLEDNSDAKIPTEKAVKTYADAIAGAGRTTETVKANADAVAALDAAAVKLTGSQEIAGEKTFSSPPIIAFTPADGTEQIYAANAVQSSVSDSYVKVKEILMPFTGIVNVYFEGKGGSPTYPVYGRIYKNGAAAGTQQAFTTDSYVAKAEAIAVEIGDRLQLYVKRTASWTVSVCNFRIRCSVALAGTIFQMLQPVVLD